MVRPGLLAASTRSSCGFRDPDAANGMIVGSSPSQAASQPIPIPISDRSQRSASAPNIPLLPLSPTRLSAAQIRADMVDSQGRSGLDWECDLHPFRISHQEQQIMTARWWWAGRHATTTAGPPFVPYSHLSCRVINVRESGCAFQLHLLCR